LLPRPWVFEGLIAGVAGAIGYGIGTLASFALRSWGVRGPGGALRRGCWWALAVVGPLFFLAAIILGGAAQNQVRRLVGEQLGAPYHVLSTAAVTVLAAAVLLLVGRAVRVITRWLGRVLSRAIPRQLAQALAVVLVILGGYWLAAGVAFQGFIAVMDTIYAAQNEGTPAGAEQPRSATHSGSASSQVGWETLGLQGRGFVGRGPSRAQIAAFTGKPAETPIRVYVGVDSAATAAERADLAVAELDRTGAFDRSVLVVAGATGTGWLEPQSVDSVEYMWGGDTAIVTIQYSFLPSWISFLVDQERATDAGRALFDAVYAKWSTLPRASRPKLITYGLSLGSFAAQAPFSGVADMAARTDGALFVGTPNFTQPWRRIVADRDRGSPQWQPTYRDGQTARFAAANGDLARPGATWPSPHVVFMQHGSDPVVWWSPDLLSRAPDWLRETRATDVSPATRWLPFITFLQVTVDQFFGVAVPVGHGHNYPNTAVYAWENVVAPPGWTQAQSDTLQHLIDTMPLE
jgi:uncharacterized membrane protein